MTDKEDNQFAMGVAALIILVFFISFGLNTIINEERAAIRKNGYVHILVLGG